MGEMVDFASNGDTTRAHLSVPASGSGPGVLVLQEWWGLVPQLTGVCDRLAGEGFVALAPDLYRGEVAHHTEMDKAASLMSQMPMERATRDMGAAINYLLTLPSVQGDKIGVIGFCMGGMLTLAVTAMQGDRIGAAAPFYGAPLGDSEPDWSGLRAPVRGHFAANDDFFHPDAIAALEKKLQGMGKDVEFRFHPGTGHAFANEENPLGTHDEAATAAAWTETIAFFHDQLR